jgi:hypothetical protein
MYIISHIAALFNIAEATPNAELAANRADWDWLELEQEQGATEKEKGVRSAWCWAGEAAARAV